MGFYSKPVNGLTNAFENFSFFAFLYHIQSQICAEPFLGKNSDISWQFYFLTFFTERYKHRFETLLSKQSPILFQSEWTWFGLNKHKQRTPQNTVTPSERCACLTYSLQGQATKLNIPRVKSVQKQVVVIYVCALHCWEAKRPPLLAVNGSLT